MFHGRHVCYKTEETSPVVYEIGGYLVSPVNSSLSYFARIHCSFKTLRFKGEHKNHLKTGKTTESREHTLQCHHDNVIFDLADTI